MTVWPRRAVSAGLRGYQRVISPLLPPACRFHPTCSEFARQAIEAHGVGRGGWMALRRLSHCHPFHPGGYDPVPTAPAGRKNSSIRSHA